MSQSTGNAHVVISPHAWTPFGKSVFLAGTISMKSPTPESWQFFVTDALSHLPITILNPHKPYWTDCKQDISDPLFKKQVTWELDNLEAADVIAMYFSPESLAAICLLELGLFARTGKMVVACPEGFWRRGNVQVVCDRFGIELVGSLEELSQRLVTILAE